MINKFSLFCFLVVICSILPTKCNTVGFVFFFQMDIIGIVTRLPSLVFGASRCDDSFADRLSYKYTVLMLVLFAIIVTNKQFGTKHIQCKKNYVVH